jgi:hypothetical protein
MKYLLPLLVFIITVGLLFNIGCDPGDYGVNNFVYLEASRIEDVSSFNGLTDSSWNLIDELTVYVTSFDQMCGGMMGCGMMGQGTFGEQEKVSIKAQYSDTHVYMLFRWPDNEKSMNRMYQYNGENWGKTEGNEDRFNIAWDIGESSPNFYMMGCMASCHYMMTDEPYMATNYSDEKLDLWHWKSQRTDPAGYADDQFIQSEVDFSADEITGRKADDKTGGSYVSNWDSEMQRPLYAPSDGNYIKRGLLKTDAVEITDYSIFKEGDMIPREILERPTGSRGDISAEAEWSDGYWTLMLSRALETENSDDVGFDIDETYPFAVSVHDNGHGIEHLTMPHTAYLSFDK